MSIKSNLEYNTIIIYWYILTFTVRAYIIFLELNIVIIYFLIVSLECG